MIGLTNGKGNSTTPTFPTTSNTADAPAVERLRIPEKIYPLWSPDTSVDVSIYIVENPWTENLHQPGVIATHRVFHEQNFKLDNKSDTREFSTDILFSPHVQHNGTLFALILLAKEGAKIDPAQPGYDPANVFKSYKALTRYFPKKKVVKVKKLIGGSNEEKEEEVVEEITTSSGTGPKIASYWHSNLTVNVVGGMGELNYGSVAPASRQYITLESTGARDETGKNGWYYPIVFSNDFWLLREHMVELNNTVKYVDFLG